MRETLKKISIRGRFAFCLACLRNAMRQENVNIESLSILFERMSSFLTTDKLDEWEKQIVDVSPDTIFDTHPDNDFNDYETVTATELVRLKAIYEKIPSAITELIDLIISVGLSNLYGGTSDYSPHSLAPTLKVIELMDSHNYELPLLQQFSRYSFTDNNGWGFPLDPKSELLQRE